MGREMRKGSLRITYWARDDGKGHRLMKHTLMMMAARGCDGGKRMHSAFNLPSFIEYVNLAYTTFIILQCGRGCECLITKTYTLIFFSFILVVSTVLRKITFLLYSPSSDSGDETRMWHVMTPSSAFAAGSLNLAGSSSAGEQQACSCAPEYRTWSNRSINRQVFGDLTMSR